MGETVVVVSGLPRTGTSMMMRILAAGDLPLLMDGKRKADEDNVHGYFVFEKSKKPADFSSWLKDTKGKEVNTFFWAEGWMRKRWPGL